MTKQINVTYIDHMGGDLSVANAARVSFSKEASSFTQEQNDRLITYLAKHKHLSPFNHCFVTFHVKAPIFVARQLVKHEYMPWNEVSRRYVDDPPEVYTPETWRARSEDKKQGSGEDHEDSLLISELVAKHSKTPVTTYNILVDQGVAPEQARMVLPQNTMTEWYWSGSLGAVSKMCSLRLKEDTQYETRLVAEQVSEVMKKLYPVSWKELLTYR